MQYDCIIIDPSSPEFNRGSFCYLPYIFYAYLKTRGLNVLLLEDFNCSQIDDVPEAEDYFVGLWSYPQIDNALVINRFLRKKPFFFGYYPLIEKLKLKERRILENEILTGIETYVNFYHDFAHILLSDCDMHLRKYEGQVYPLFTSYGCPNGC